MSRKKVAVHSLARESNIDPIEVFFKLSEAGIKIKDEHGSVPKSKLSYARRILNLESKPEDKRLAYIPNLLAKLGISETELRSRLSETKIVLKKKITRIPKSILRKLELALGLRKQYEPIEISEPTQNNHVTQVKQEKIKKAKQSQKRNDFTWSIIGPKQGMIYLTSSDIEEIHWKLVRDFASSKDPLDPPGVRNKNLLESAVFRPKTSLGNNDKYPTVAMAGASLLHSIILNHPFYNGNKRTALVSLLVFMDKNGWLLTVDQDTIYNYLLDITRHNLTNPRTEKKSETSDEEVHIIANWLQHNIRKVTRGEHPLYFRELRDILETYGCTFEVSSGKSRINIMRDNLKTQIFYKGEGREIDIALMHRVREELKLDEKHGYDSDIFYNRSPRIPDFINEYRKVLKRLAKV